MKENGYIQAQILSSLKQTRMKFSERCDTRLLELTGKSLVKDEPTLWANVRGHRSKFRNKIANSSLVPEEIESEKAINEFEIAITWVEVL